MNTFSLILVIATVVTGLFYVYDVIKQRPQRKANLKRALEQCPTLGKREQRELREGSGVVVQIAGLFPILLIVFLFRAFIYEPFRIPSGSMEPTLVAGDFIAVSKWSYGIRNPLTNRSPSVVMSWSLNTLKTQVSTTSSAWWACRAMR